MPTLMQLEAELLKLNKEAWSSVELYSNETDPILKAEYLLKANIIQNRLMKLSSEINAERKILQEIEIEFFNMPVMLECVSIKCTHSYGIGTTMRSYLDMQEYPKCRDCGGDMKPTDEIQKLISK